MSICPVWSAFRACQAAPASPHKSAAVATETAHSAEQLSFYTRIAEAEDWDAPQLSGHYLLSAPYLAALEDSPPKGLRTGYAIWREAGRPVAKAYFQFMRYRLLDSLPQAAARPRWQRWLLARIDFDVMLLGNVLFTGEHGLQVDERLPEARRQPILAALCAGALREARARWGLRPQMLLAKEWPESAAPRALFEAEGFVPFCVQPNMVLPILPAWRHFDDYLEAMSSKYRVRARRAAKKAQGIQKVRLQGSRLAAFVPDMQRLYEAVIGQSEFSVASLGADYWANMAGQLGDAFQVHAYFYEERLVAFYSTLRHEGGLEAHYLGYDPALNHDKQLYLNMLYDMVALAIQQRSPRLIMARTAMEIKSSVGAQPIGMECYAKSYWPGGNPLFRYLLRRLDPSPAWQQRHPFREEAGVPAL